MKRTGYIYEKIVDKDNIREAILKASKGKKKRKVVRNVLENIDKATDEIYEMLKNKTYIPSPYIVKTIIDHSSKKTRVIHVPKFYPDQIIQWALLLQAAPILERGMYAHTCASVKGRGVHYGKRYMQRWLRRDRKNTKWCLKSDISKYYPSVDNQKLKDSLRRVIKCHDTLKLFDAIIDTADGLPIGNVTSQYLANFYLQPFDHFVKQTLGVKYYMRYNDDIVLLGPNKKTLHKIKRAADEFLADMGLKQKDNWQVFRTDDRGIDYLGFRFFHRKTILRRGLMLRITRKVKRTHKRKSYNAHNARSIISYLGWIKHSDSRYLFDERIKPYINIKKLKEVIRNADNKPKAATHSL